MVDLTVNPTNDTNICMISENSTRQRILDAAARLFADSGFRGASVRDICNLAGANPGAVSYHFGGKRQLYRAVLRRAADRLAAVGELLDDVEPVTEPEFELVAIRVLHRVVEDETAARLLLRDLADGGTIAVESLTPPLRIAFQRISVAIGGGDTPHPGGQARRIFLALAAPLFLLTAGWPVVAQVLELEDAQRDALVSDLVGHVLARSGRATSGNVHSIMQADAE